MIIARSLVAKLSHCLKFPQSFLRDTWIDDG